MAAFSQSSHGFSSVHIFFLSCKDILDQSPSVWLYLMLITSLKALPSNLFTLAGGGRVKASTSEFVNGTIQAILGP